jgi:hypothetical protein
VIVISRFAVAEHSAEDFLARARLALGAFAARPGYLRGWIGRAADDPGLWTITTEWSGVGAFRRSLSGFDVKMYAAPLLAESISEPAAYEIIVGMTGGNAETTATGRHEAPPPTGSVQVAPSGRAADAGQTRVGESATAYAPRSVDPAASRPETGSSAGEHTR